MIHPTSTLAVVVVLALTCMVGPSSSVRLSGGVSARGDGGGFRIADDDGDMEPLGAQAAPERRGRVVLPAAASLMRFSERRQEAPSGKGKAGGKGKGASGAASGAGSESEAPRVGAGVGSAAPVSASASARAARDTADATADAAVATATAATAVATTKARKLLTNAEMRAHFDALSRARRGRRCWGASPSASR